MAQIVQEDPTRDALVQQALRKYWGFETLRPLQKEVVSAALNNRDAVVVMPTGGGKSLCFQLPSVVTRRLTVVVSPLIALMKDQVDGLKVVGVSAAALNSSMSQTEEFETRRQVTSGELDLLYLSPERLLNASTLDLLRRADQGQGVARFAIDEAHCISAWGHDFRTEFRQLNRIKEAFPGVPVQAFTATATPKVQRDIAIQLKLDRPRLFVGIFDRPNLTYRVVAKDDPVKLTVDAVRRYPDEGVIVYCLSRKDTEAIANALVSQGIPAVAYHAGLTPETRKKVSEDFAGERANIIVATIAFGMGIDRANVRCVIHECIPKSMEGYQQETGRAGRDGLPSECVLLYSNSDVVRLKRLLESGEPSTLTHHLQLLDEVRRFASSHQCRHKTLSEHFGQSYDLAAEGCGACDVCLGGMKPLDNGNQVGHEILRTVSDLLGGGRGRFFGVALLVSVLTGSRAKAVLERGGEALAGFGAFASEAKERVSSWVHQLVDMDLLSISEGQYPVVSITERGRAVVEGGTEISIMENVALVPVPGSRRSRAADIREEGPDNELFDSLRTWRRETAAAQQVPAYLIFHDATLIRIASVRPSTVEALKSIPGVGDRRAQDYGEQIVDLVRLFAEERGLPLDQGFAFSPKPAAAPISTKSSLYGSYFQSGLSMEEVAVKMGVKPSTVATYLAEWIEQERPPSIDAWVDPETQSKVTAVLPTVDTEFLKPIHEALDGTVSYEFIKIVRAFAKSNESTG